MPHLQHDTSRQNLLANGVTPGFCACGCGARPRGYEARWLPGHDMRGVAGFLRMTDAQRNRAARRAAGVRPQPTQSRLGVNRRFGIEIECNIPGGRYGAAAAQLIAQLPTGWRCKSDGSLGRNGCEVVSPPLHGEAGFEQLRSVLALITQAGGTVDQACGLHVHLEVADCGRQGMMRFVRSWAANQSLINGLISPSRRNSRWAAPWTQAELDHPARVGRYKAVNIQSFAIRGTVEIRQHQGTLSFRKIEAWTKMAMSMLDTCAVGASSVVAPQETVSGLFTRIGLSTFCEDSAAYLLGRAVQWGIAPVVSSNASPTAVS